MKIQPIVEGHGEVSAVPELLRRLLQQSGAHEIGVGKPIRRTRSELVQESGLRKSVRLALLRPDTGAVLILFDSDDDCPKQLAPQIEAWAKSEAGTVPCAVVIAHREYEAWFLAAVESLRNRRGIRADALQHPNPESPRNAKKEIELRMHAGASYSETIDQAPLTALFDMRSAYAHCRSFRRMTNAFGLLVTGMGIHTQEWPPAEWHQP